MPAVLRDGPVDHRQAESGAAAAALGREERLEDVRPDVLRHARSGVGHGEHDVVAGLHAVVGLHVLFVQPDVGRLNRQLAAVWHGVPGVDREVHQNLFTLAGIEAHESQTGGYHRLQIDVLADQPLQHRPQALNHVVHAENLGSDDLLA